MIYVNAGKVCGNETIETYVLYKLCSPIGHESYPKRVRDLMDYNYTSKDIAWLKETRMMSSVDY